LAYSFERAEEEKRWTTGYRKARELLNIEISLCTMTVSKGGCAKRRSKKTTTGGIKEKNYFIHKGGAPNGGGHWGITPNSKIRRRARTRFADIPEKADIRDEKKEK